MDADKRLDKAAIRALTDDQLLDALRSEGEPGDEKKEKGQASQKEEDYTIATPDGVIIAEVAHHDVSAMLHSPRVRIVDMRVRTAIPKDRPPDHGH